MPVPFQGGCLCGDIRYECSALPKYTYFRHCRDCQKASGSAFHAGIMVAKEAVRLLSGVPTAYTVTGASGKTIAREFCPRCGSPLFLKLAMYEKNLVIKAGSMDDPSWLEPQAHLWTRTEMPWAHLEDGLERMPEVHG